VRAFSIFYVGVNIGAFLAPLVCGTLGEQAGWHYGFAAAGVGMLIGAGIYLFGLPALPPDELTRARRRAHRKEAARRPRTPDHHRAVRAVRAGLAVLGDLRPAGQHDRAVGRRIHAAHPRSGRVSGTVPTTWFLALNPLMIFGFTPLLLSHWARQAARGREPSSITRMSQAYLYIVAANLVMAAGAWAAGDGGKASGFGSSAISSSSPSVNSISHRSGLRWCRAWRRPRSCR